MYSSRPGRRPTWVSPWAAASRARSEGASPAEPSRCLFTVVDPRGGGLAFSVEEALGGGGEFDPADSQAGADCLLRQWQADVARAEHNQVNSHRITPRGRSEERRVGKES